MEKFNEKFFGVELAYYKARHYEIGEIDKYENWIEFTVVKDGNVVAVTASPRNGTKYRLVIVTLTGPQMKIMESNRCLVYSGFSNNMNDFFSMSEDYWTIHEDYIMEKLRVCSVDAFCIAVILDRTKQQLDHAEKN